MTTAQRKHIDNGIWMCGHHASLIDDDKDTYSRELLITWKFEVEARAKLQQQFPSRVSVQTQRVSHEHLFQESIARCATRWMALGLEHPQALELAKDQSIGALEMESTDFAKPVLVIQGPLGAGKSLGLERAFQSALNDAATDLTKPLPLFLIALEAQKFETRVLEHCANVGVKDPSNMTIFVDGADEISRSNAEDLINAARQFSLTWQGLKVRLTSRPLESLAHSSEVFEIPELSEQASLDLIGKILGQTQPYEGMLAYPDSIQEAVKRPFFAVLLAAHEKDKNAGQVRSTGELLDWLVDRAISQTKRKPQTAQKFLERLAQQSIDQGGKSVHLKTLGSRVDLQAFLESGLVEQIGQNVRFSLPVLTQWFAAQSLDSGQPDIQEIVKDPRRLDRWRYPIGMLVSKGNFESITQLLEPIATSDVGFIGIILHDALSLNHFRPSGELLPDESECVRRIDIAMNALTRGLGPTANRIAPQQPDGTPRTLWARVDQYHLTVGWADPEFQRQYEKAIGQPSDIAGFEGGGQSGNIDTRQEGWPWELAFQRLTNTLKTRLRNREFDVDHGPIAEENFWSVALAFDKYFHDSRQPPGMIKVYGPTPESISFDSYFSYIELDIDSDSVLFQNVDFNPKRLVEQRNSLLEQGIPEARPPWPLPDQIQKHLRTHHTGGIQDWYSDDQLLVRTIRIYSGALGAYQDLVERWFPTFKQRLLLSVTLPAKFGGFLERGHLIPTLTSRFEPLLMNEESRVDITFGSGGYDWDDVFCDHVRKMRPQAAEWIYPLDRIGSVNHIGNDQNPMTRLAYDWLESDLKLLRWI